MQRRHVRGYVWALVGMVGISTSALAAPLRQSAGIALASAPITTPAVVKSVRGGLVHSVTLLCPTSACEVAIYDVTTAPVASGTPLWEGRVAVANDSKHFDFPVPLMTTNGIEVEVSGGGKAFVTYE